MGATFKGFQGIKVYYSGKEPQMDILAIHGIETSNHDTWARKGEIQWLADSHLRNAFTSAGAFFNPFDVEKERSISLADARAYPRNTSVYPAKHTSQESRNARLYQAWIDGLLDKTPVYQKRPQERSILPVLINGEHFDGFPDTNATRNVMTESFAVSIGAVIDRATTYRATFTNAIGEKTMSIGQTSLEVAFPDNTEKLWSCLFQVVKDCPESLVFGEYFLRTMTETLTKFRHRLKKVVISGMNRIRRLLHMEMPSQKLGCQIDSQLAFANMDTGSDTDLVSLEYAESRDWDISYLPSDEGYVMLSNRTMKKVLGYVDKWLNVGHHGTMRRFYVLDGLISDVILGDETLENLDVFNKHVDSFMDSGGLEEMETFYMIEWRERYDSVERNVETLLRAAEGVPGAEGPSLRQRFAHVLRRGPKNARTGGPVKCDVQLQLRRTLEDFDRLEDHLDDQSHMRLEKLKGDDMLQEKQSNELRKQRYQDLRHKILGSLQSFDKITKG